MNVFTCTFVHINSLHYLVFRWVWNILTRPLFFIEVPSSGKESEQTCFLYQFCLCFYDISISFWNCLDNVVYFSVFQYIMSFYRNVCIQYIVMLSIFKLLIKQLYVLVSLSSDYLVLRCWLNNFISMFVYITYSKQLRIMTNNVKYKNWQQALFLTIKPDKIPNGFTAMEVARFSIAVYWYFLL